MDDPDPGAVSDYGRCIQRFTAEADSDPSGVYQLHVAVRGKVLRFEK